MKSTIHYPMDVARFYENRAGTMINQYYNAQWALVSQSLIEEGIRSEQAFIEESDKLKKEHLSPDKAEAFLDKINAALDEFFPNAETFFCVLGHPGDLTISVKVQEPVESAKYLPMERQ